MTPPNTKPIKYHRFILLVLTPRATCSEMVELSIAGSARLVSKGRTKPSGATRIVANDRGYNGSFLLDFTDNGHGVIAVSQAQSAR